MVNMGTILKNKEIKKTMKDFFNLNKNLLGKIELNATKKTYGVELLESRELPYNPRSDLLVGLITSEVQPYILKLVVWIAANAGHMDENGYNYIYFDNEKIIISNEKTNSIKINDWGLISKKENNTLLKKVLYLFNKRKINYENSLMLELHNNWLAYILK